MMPILFEIGPIKIYSFGFMLVVAFYTCYYLLQKDMKRLGYEAKIASDMIFAAAVGGILGSKIYYLIEHFDRVIDDPFGMIFSGSGLVFLGGLMGGTLGVTIVLRKNNLPWIKFADIVAPLLILGYAIGRVGCFLVGDDYGVPTHLPWGVSFENGLPPTTYRIFESYYPWVDLTGFEPGLLTVHPTQLYEVSIGLAIFAFLWNRRTKIKVFGSLFFTYLIIAGIERFSIEFIRTNNHFIFDLTGAQLISIGMIIMGTVGLLRPVSKPEIKP
ncbi:MAG: prolipoprotein diacylglyceryl transferase [Candidatus Marinimicrobia bacterium]|nr:prolipoprotein diacylglyceryl transferase [Candidatus Neomarinimicrobiota bacterium]MCH7763163.1 prolipoprotein diacylglyceryl transferase [Candidatus Neomarinimicrobiota bacterium]